MGRTAILVLVIACAAPARASDPAVVPAAATLRVGVPPEPDPAAGFDRSLFAEVARVAGFGVIFDAMPAAAARAALDAGRLDVAAGPFPLDARPGDRALLPVAATGDALLKRRGDGSVKTAQDLAGKVLGLLAPPGGGGKLRREVTALRARLDPRPKAFGDPLRDLAAGRLAAVVGAVAELTAVALAHPDGFEVVGPPIGPTVRLAPLMRADRPDLAVRLDAAIAAMKKDGRLADLQRRWFGILFDPPDQPVAP